MAHVFIWTFLLEIDKDTEYGRPFLFRIRRNLLALRREESLHQGGRPGPAVEVSTRIPDLSSK
jgi:hypothetical protein